MSLRVLVIPEHPKHDRHILEPIVRKLFREVKRRVRINVLQDHRYFGVDRVLKRKSLRAITRDYGMSDLYLVMVDNDAKPGRSEAAAAFESQFTDLFVCLAIEEVEVWMLALHKKALDAPWRKVRSEKHSKEVYAEPFLQSHSPRLSPVMGRKRAMHALQGTKWQTLEQSCPELATLRQKIENWLASKQL